MAENLAYNYRFCLEWARRRGGRVLDFGCGAGATVRAGLAEDLDIYGADVFFDASPEYQTQVADLLGERVRKITDGQLPFPDGFFSAVVSNQVFEHVEDLSAVARELRRVVRPGGKILALFPTRETLREGHCGVVLAHWMVHTPLFRPWMKINRVLGLSYPNWRSPTQWADHFHEYITRYCYYRSRQEIARIFGDAGLPVRFMESEYVRLRWGWPPLGAAVYRLSAGTVLEAG